MDLITLANAVGLSLPLTLLALAALVHFHAAPPLIATLAERQPWIVAPGVIACAVILFLLEVLAGKSKILKPVRHVLDVAQLVLKPIVAAAFTLSVMSPTAPVASADGAPVAFRLASSIPIPNIALGAIPAHAWWYVVAAALIAMLVHTIRAASDFVATMTLLPLVDAAVSTIFELYAVGMILMFIWAPTLASTVCVAQLLVCLVLLGRITRIAMLYARLTFIAITDRDSTKTVVPSWVSAHSGAGAVLDAWVEGGGPWGRFGRVWVFATDRGIHVLGWRLLRRTHDVVPFDKIKWVGATAGLVADQITVHSQADRKPLLVLGLEKNQSATRSALLDALRAQKMPVDEATRNGERLPASFRSSVSG